MLGIMYKNIEPIGAKLCPLAWFPNLFLTKMHVFRLNYAVKDELGQQIRNKKNHSERTSIILFISIFSSF
jgi:hypothetical protein